MLIKVLKMVLMAQAGSLLGCSTRNDAPQRGITLGPLRLLPTHLVPSFVVGVLCGGSSIYSLLTSFVLGALVGDKLEQR